MRNLAIIILGVIGLFSAYAENPNVWANKKEMNGYSYDEYKGFWDKWKLVTARFRTDNGEIRLTYANEKAAEVLKNGGDKFPDGAAFGKIAFETSPDELFPSSLVPAKSKRYQLMIKDAKKHPNTRGWGYAIFDSNGVTLPENPISIQSACAACHEYAAKRDFVFLGSLPTLTAHVGKPLSEISKGELAMLSKWNFQFVERPIHQAPVELHATFKREGYDTVEYLDGELRHKNFVGTFDEIQPILTRRALQTKLPTLLVDANDDRWVAAYLTEEFGARCEKNGRAGTNLVVEVNGPKGAFKGRKILCEVNER